MLPAMLKIVDRFLDHITMYRLVLWYLIALLAAAMALSLAGFLPYTPLAIAMSTALVLAVCWLANIVFARVFEVPANRESVYITALIVALIMDPVGPGDIAGIGALVFAAIWAVASKFIFAIGRKHLFNPAAFGVLLPALLLDRPATWWLGGSLLLLPVVMAGGLLMVRKLRRFDLVATFLLATLATILVTTPPAGYAMAISQTLKYSPIFFFAFVMLTEPLTAPTMRWPRLAFGALVGMLFAPNIHIGDFYLTPEMALLVGNLFAWAISPKGRFVLVLERIEQTAADTFDFVFQAPRRLAFSPGQYLEWTLAMPKSDNRGNRRYFTIASAPGEETVRMGVKFPERLSAFKRQLARMAPGDTIHAAQLAGDFTLPADRNRKLAFIAGGIGITPFRSMLQDLIDRDEARPITVLYGVEYENAIAYRDVLDHARHYLGIPTVFAVANRARQGHYPGRIDARLIRIAIPDFRERTFYISGPQPMVQSVRSTLTRLGVHRSRIKVDFFPGFA